MKKKGLIPEDHSDIKLVPAAKRRIWEKWDEAQRDAEKKKRILANWPKPPDSEKK